MDSNEILIVGVGGAGGRLVDALAVLAPTALRTVMIDTDSKALAASRAVTKLQIGTSVVKGNGAGGDGAKGRRAANEDVEMIRGLFVSTGMAVVVTGLGGGTGSTVTTEVLKAAGLAGMTSLCFATQPFGFEGAPRTALARAAVPEIRAVTDGLILVPNDKLFESVGSDSISEAFPKADTALATGLLALWQLLTRPGYLNAGPAELAHVTRPERGIASLAWAEARGRRRAESAVKQLLAHPMIEGGAVLNDCRSLLVSIVGGEDLTLKDLGDIMEPIKAVCNDEVDITVGTSVDSEWKSRLLLTLIATRPGGWSTPEARANTLEPTLTLPTRADAPPPRNGRGGVQTTMQLEPAGRGRFKNTDPTLMDGGEDLDIPTYQRRGIRL
ncbi:MAG: hypothetical protein HQ523_04430 [Lentisphaerae bacterium]|nr:hypothetical protein [Lentisphaerota bacterium]